jgi:protein-S-isoprenylcysteine O-methyltransferase Ste14
VTLIPEFRLALINGWIFFLIYIGVFFSIILSFKKTVVKRLYYRSLRTERQILLIITGKFITFINIILIILSPIRFNLLPFMIGIIIFVSGLIGLIVSLLNYSSTPIDKPVTKGIYNISRHPQIFSIWILFLGICFIIGSLLSLFLLLISLIFLHTSVLAEEKSCLKQYGELYKNFIKNTPRYFLFF